MGKRFWSVALSVALVAGVFSALPAKAQVAPAVPAEPNVTDPTGDANYLNDQGLNAIVGRDGDHAGPADASTSADLMAGWFTNDAQSVTAHILVEGALPSTPSYFYRVHVDPTGGEDDCLWFQAGIPGVADAGPSPDPIGNLRNLCGDGSIVDGEVSLAENPDGGTIVSIKVPMGTHGLAIGMTLGSPNISVRNWPRSPQGSATAPQVDNTKLGLPYEISAGGPVVEPAPDEEPPGKNDPPGKGKKKGCKKGKGKKKGACPGKKPGKPEAPADTCPAYVPGEEGAEAETSVVTDAATEEKPVEVDLTAPAGGGNDLVLGVYDETASIYQNIQVDSASADTGLYVRYEFSNFHDYDLYLNYPDGSTAANSGDFNAAPGEGLGGGSPDGAWEAGTNYEQVMGIRTADCGGYTARLSSYLTTGGATKLKAWLGPVVADPVPPAGDEGAATAADMFFGAMRMQNPMIDPAEASSVAAAKKKKKKKKKSPPVAACAPLATGEQGADKPTIVLTDDATAEAPVEQTVTLAQSLSEGIVDAESYDYFNVQVDSAAASAGLYATFEFPTRRDYDIYARWPDGSEAASSHGFNPLAEASAPQPVPDPSNTRTNHAGETTASSENLVGVITPDCGGYTIETVNWLGEGGELTVKLWLGEGVTEPLAQGERP